MTRQCKSPQKTSGGGLHALQMIVNRRIRVSPTAKRGTHVNLLMIVHEDTCCEAPTSMAASTGVCWEMPEASREEGGGVEPASKGKLMIPCRAAIRTLERLFMVAIGRGCLFNTHKQSSPSPRQEIDAGNLDMSQPGVSC